MAKHVLIALTNPVSGEEEAYNTWYEQVHIPEILIVPGILSARRFRTKIVNAPGVPAWQYVAIYEVDTDDLKTLLQDLGKAAGVPISALDESMSGTIVAKEIFASAAASST